MADSMPPTPPPPPPSYGGGAMPPSPTANYAGWGARVGAYIVDYIPIFLLNGIGWLVAAPKVTTVETANGFSATTTSGLGALFWLFWLIGIVYWLWNRVFRMGTTGQSLGMGVAKTRALGERTGEPLGVGMNFVRQLLLIVDFAICYIGVLWPLWDAKKQCLLSDKVASAIVVKA